MNCIFGCFYFILLSTVLIDFVRSYDTDKEISNLQRLKDKLLTNYDPKILPVPHHTNLTKVYANLVPKYLVDLDEEFSLFYMDSYVWMRWNDYRLAWNPDDFDGVKRIALPSYKIWLPALAVMNGHSGDVDVQAAVHAGVSYDGSVSMRPSSAVAARCPIKPGPDYPRDTVVCTVELSIRTYHGWEIDLEVSHDEYTKPRDAMYMYTFENNNPRWEIIVEEAKIRKVVKKFECCAEPYVKLTASFHAKRRSPPELDVVWLPCVLIMTLTLAMFWIPSESKKKILFGVLLCKALAVLVTYVSFCTKAPLSAVIAVSFLETTMYAVVIALLLEIFILNLNKIMGPLRPPVFLVNILSGPLGKYTAIWASWEADTPSSGDFKQLKDDVLVRYPTPSEEWNLIATGIDRLLFVLFIIVMAAIHQV